MIRAAALALALAACAHTARPIATRLDATAQLVDPSSQAPFAAAARFHGRVVVLDFWASWCAQCRETVPQVVRLADAFAAQGLVVIGVNAGDRATEATAAAHAFGITYPIALDLDLDFADRLGAAGLPTLVVLDRDGSIVHRAKHVDAETLEVIRRQLSAAPSPIPNPQPPLPSSAPPLP